MQLRELIPSWPKFVSDNFSYLKQFVKTPVHSIKSLPDWNWLEMAVLLLVFSVASGLTAGAVAKSFTQILAGIFLLPISSLFFCAFTVAVIYYFSFFVLKRDLNLKKLSTVVLLSSLPSLIFHPLVNFFPPVFFIGFLIIGVNCKDIDAVLL
jgi:hypothetical protein